MLTMLRNMCVQNNLLKYGGFFHQSTIFWKLNLMYICTPHCLSHAIYQIVLEMSCEFSLFPHCQIIFSSIVSDLTKIFLIR